ncbi:glucosamine-6-phosphate deaminase [Aureibaculum marinum]|uniref:Glucosamine-6-phosphate deaminase n=1 Tax=Aureibaculum marinum TaxID=2487930 RepID=A0A3N4NHE1_9FLAO|nr:glucosamine-6-phosphate deaminase [Aureibaculum marinum]RPD95842.1 glucosamine-6-phosphate deaminase [Aureibaculum marinum]
MSDIKQDVNVFSDKKTTGHAAGKAIEACIVNLLSKQSSVRIVFAAAPSQDTMLDYLSKSNSIDWSRVIAFHMDEYIGLNSNAPELFSAYLENHLFSKVNIKSKNIINVQNGVANELNRYAYLLEKEPIDIVCLGIGENGHIAFNDPPVADFNDPEVVKVVQLDKACRTQQVHDGCFKSLDDVPKTAITLTIPTLLKGNNLFCIVIGKNKSLAVKNTLTGPISTSCPASILTTHKNCKFYFDSDAYMETLKLEKV